MKMVISLSGGMDSATVLGWALKELGVSTICVSFTYGSKHNEYENKAARQIAEFYKQSIMEINLNEVMKSFKSDLLKTGDAIPEGYYNDSSMSKTVVPARNIIFTSILSGIAWSNDAKAVALGIHQGDHTIYPDCRPAFFYTMNQAIKLGTDNKVSLIAPFLDTDKFGILKWGLANGVPYHLTRTCYKDQPLACGKCGSCVERLEAFSKLSITDPVLYEKEKE